MNQEEELEGVATEQHGSQKPKYADIQALSTRLLYDLVRQKKVTSTIVFADLFTNY